MFKVQYSMSNLQVQHSTVDESDTSQRKIIDRIQEKNKLTSTGFSTFQEISWCGFRLGAQKFGPCVLEFGSQSQAEVE